VQVQERAASPPTSPRSAERAVFQAIVNNALEATGARMVHMSRFDPLTQETRVVAWAAPEGGPVHRVLHAARQRFPELDLSELIIPATVNPSNQRVYLHGEPVLAPFLDMSHGMVSDQVLQLVAARTNIRWVFTCPIRLGNVVTGALAYHLMHRLTDALQHTCEAFAREAALTLENARLLETLRQQVAELQRSRRLITAAEERQRQEIAELLHGRVQTSLLVAWHRLGLCEGLLDHDPATARTLIAEVRQQIDHIREHEVREASHLLHPSIIQVGLVPAVRSLAERFHESFDADLQVDPALATLDDPAENRLPPHLRLAAYRVIEEALNNCYRHAGARHVSLCLRATPEQELHLTIQDDGCGFDPARLRPGLGFSSIADRVGQVGGLWKITSAPGAGTTLSITLPLRPPEPA
jgi:signal transduction histidine kinase